MEKILLSFALFFGFSLFISCNGTTEEHPPSAFHYNSYSMEHPTCSDDIRNGQCMFVEFIYPHFEGSDPVLNDSLGKQVAQFFSDSTVIRLSQDLLMDTAGRLFGSYDSTLSYFDDYSLPWMVEKHVSIRGLTEHYITVEFRDRRFTGGAHGTDFRYYRTYNRNPFGELKMDDLVRAGNRDALRRIAEKRFRLNRQLGYNRTLEEAGFWFPDGRFAMPVNAGLTNKGLLLYYNAYEVAPYAEGPTSVLIPFDELTGILNPRYLPSHLERAAGPGERTGG